MLGTGGLKLGAFSFPRFRQTFCSLLPSAHCSLIVKELPSASAPILPCPVQDVKQKMTPLLQDRFVLAEKTLASRASTVFGLVHVDVGVGGENIDDLATPDAQVYSSTVNDGDPVLNRSVLWCHVPHEHGSRSGIGGLKISY